MAPSPATPAAPSPPAWIEVSGFKALHDPVRAQLRPLTLFAGANSSGKSSVMQPILMLKQTLEAPYDPGPLLLDGPHVQFTEPEQFLSRGKRKAEGAEALTVALGPIPQAIAQVAYGPGSKIRWLPTKRPSPEVRVSFHRKRGSEFHLGAPVVAQRAGDRWVKVSGDLPLPDYHALVEAWSARDPRRPPPHVELVTRVDRFSVRVLGSFEEGHPPLTLDPLAAHVAWIRSILHLPGLRGHRDRRYPTARVSTTNGTIQAAGPFTPYAASVLVDWAERNDKDRIGRVNGWLKALGLTWTVKAQRVSTAEVELKVGRTSSAQQGGANDLVDIADVGFGVSQVLPVLVALAAAARDQVVYIEQPELHLHPRAQWAMGTVLAEASALGVRVVVETHSRMVLRAIQTAIAAGKLDADNVGMHWFSRDDETGFSRVVQAEVAGDGSFGQWPIDFSDVEADADDAWLDQVLGGGA